MIAALGSKSQVTWDSGLRHSRGVRGNKSVKKKSGLLPETKRRGHISPKSRRNGFPKTAKHFGLSGPTFRKFPATSNIISSTRNRWKSSTSPARCQNENGDVLSRTYPIALRTV